MVVLKSVLFETIKKRLMNSHEMYGHPFIGTFQYLCTNFKTSKGALIMKRYGYYNPKGRYLDEESSSIWLNEQEIGTYWIVDMVCQMGGSRVSVWKTERDLLRKEMIFIHICYFRYS